MRGASAAGPRPGRFLPGDPRVEEPYRLTPQLAFRVALMAFLALGVFAVLFLRLWALQVLSGEKYLAVANDNRVRSGFCGFERLGHSQRDVLAVVANNVILEWWASLVGDAFESLSLNRAEDLADVLPMKDRSHAGHFLRCNEVEFSDFAPGYRCLHRHAIKQARKMEVRSVLRLSGYLERAIYAPRVATDR